MILAEREIESRMLNLVYCKAQVGNCVNDVAKVSKKAADEKTLCNAIFWFGGRGGVSLPICIFCSGVLFNHD